MSFANIVLNEKSQIQKNSHILYDFFGIISRIGRSVETKKKRLMIVKGWET